MVFVSHCNINGVIVQIRILQDFARWQREWETWSQNAQIVLERIPAVFRGRGFRFIHIFLQRSLIFFGMYSACFAQCIRTFRIVIESHILCMLSVLHSIVNYLLSIIYSECFLTKLSSLFQDSHPLFCASMFII